VDITNKSGICDAYEKFIWEPMIVRMNCLIAATEVRSLSLSFSIFQAACTILSIDETVKNPKAAQD